LQATSFILNRIHKHPAISRVLDSISQVIGAGIKFPCPFSISTSDILYWKGG
jgi:hypothetical protein